MSFNYIPFEGDLAALGTDYNPAHIGDTEKLPWEPLRIFKAIDPSDGQIGIMEPAYSYMVQHALDDED